MPPTVTLELRTHKRHEVLDITAEVQDAVHASGVASGLCVVFCPHTTAAIAVNENTDPDVRTDLFHTLKRLVPKDDPAFRHAEGNSDAHTLSILAGAQQTFIVEQRKLLLGRWQAVYFIELDGPRSRQAYVKVVAG